MAILAHDVMPFASPPWMAMPAIRLSGELDIATRPSLTALLATAERLDRITLDLRDVTFLDASALGCFVHLRNAMRPCGQSCIRMLVRPRHARLLRLARIDSLFELDVFEKDA